VHDDKYIFSIVNALVKTILIEAAPSCIVARPSLRFPFALAERKGMA